MKKNKNSSLNIIKIISIFIVLLLTLTFMFVFPSNKVFASTLDDVELKTYYQGTIEDDFNNDNVIVVLTKEATRKFQTYTPLDFSEIDCVSVEDLTKYTVEEVEKRINGKETNEEILINSNEFRRILCLELKEKTKENVLKAIKILEKRNDILSAEPNITVQMNAQSNDSRIEDQWGLSKINAFNSWNFIKGHNSVLVGVMDTGIDSTHEDLHDIIHRSYPHTITTTLHRDFTTGTTNGEAVLDPIDPKGHGTHVSGIIGGKGNNSIGISGVCWDIRLVSLRVLNSSGSGSMGWVINAINYAASIDIPLLNCSLGSSAETGMILLK